MPRKIKTLNILFFLVLYRHLYEKTIYGMKVIEWGVFCSSKLCLGCRQSDFSLGFEIEKVTLWERDRRRYLSGKILLALCFILGIHFSLTDIENDFEPDALVQTWLVKCTHHAWVVELTSPEQAEHCFQGAGRILNVKPTVHKMDPHSH